MPMPFDTPRRRLRHRRVGLPDAIAAFTLACCASAAPAQEPASLLAGAYTEEQAIRGQALYYRHCLQCHGESLAGVDKAPPLAGPQFSSTWTGAPLATLVTRIQSMPPEKPGSLSREDSVDVLSYILWYNGLPLGSAPLEASAEALGRIRFRAPAPQ